MALLPNDQVEAAKSADILKLFAEYGVDLRPNGSEFSCLCPFHDEKSPSCSVEPSPKNMFYCFGCGASGDPINFVMQMENCSFRDAVQKINGNSISKSERPAQVQIARPIEPPKWFFSMPGESAPPIPKKLGVRLADGWQDFPIIASWEYRNGDGDLVGYATRVEIEPGKKQVIPLTWQTSTETGEQKWRQGSMPTPRPLYGADLLAANPSAQVLVVEGEKTCDAARRLLDGTGVIVVSWAGGGKAVAMSDWRALAGRKVVLWPDADSKREKNRSGDLGPFLHGLKQPGMFTMISLMAGLSRDGAAGVRVVDCQRPGEVADGWDLADAEAEGWDRARVLEFMKSRMFSAEEMVERGEDYWSSENRVEDTAGIPTNEQEYDTEDHEPDNAPPPDYEQHAPPPAGQSTAPVERELPFRFLGWDAGVGYYLPVGFRQVVSIASAGHIKLNLLQLAPLQYWAETFPSEKRSGDGVDWTMAAATIIQRAQRLGKYNPDLVRGRGAWWDNGRHAVHLGDCVVIDGTRYELHKAPSEFIYEISEPARISLDRPLGNLEARRLVNICERLRWETPVFGKLLAGWVFLAPICGALDWRPHLWVTGSAGSGKSTVINHVVGRVLSHTRLYVQGNTTEAGIRQRLRRDALPVMFDEFESETRAMDDRTQQVMGLVTQSSSESGAEILKGGSNNKAEGYKIRSMFVFSSISVNLKQHAARSRVTVMSLVSEPESKENIDKYESLMADIVNTLTPDYVDQLQARAVSMIPTIRKNAVTFAKATALVTKTRRMGDQIGTLVAGAYALHSGKLISDAEALAWVQSQQWDQVTDAHDSRDEHQCIQHLLDTTLRVETPTGVRTRSIGELIERVSKSGDGGADNDISQDEAYDTMKRVGIRCELTGLMNDYCLRVAADHKELRKLLADTPWSSSWDRHLLRIPGAIKATNQRYGYKSARGVEIPLAAIFGQE